jgi:hypothetical protein
MSHEEYLVALGVELFQSSNLCFLSGGVTRELSKNI